MQAGNPGGSRRPHRIAVIGAGYAGLACAVELAAAGRAVTVFESSKVLGGRARVLEWDGLRLDNGQHLLSGAYAELLRLMRLVDPHSDSLFRRLPLDLRFVQGFRLRVPRLPAPLHLAAALVAARGPGWRERLAAVCFMRALKKGRYRLAQDTDVASLLAQHGQGEKLRRYLWDPLCLAALNTPPERASAAVFCNVLRDALGGNRKASDLLFPAVDLSILFPEPASDWLLGKGAQIVRGNAIRRIELSDHAVRVDGGDFSHAVLAVGPYAVPALLPPEAAFDPLRAALQNMAHEPIATAYFRFAPEVRLPGPMLGSASGLIQWVFDRGRIDGHHGVLAVVISASGPHLDLARDELLDQLAAELAKLFPRLPAPHARQLVIERRATFACAPGLARPRNATPHTRLWLAGDYTAGDYPATLEAAVRSGVRAARGVLMPV
ncbi:MAG: hydroxysqualene dehydroxylase HpnE [Rhodocyclaceae bacterium]|nr:FAD-dependent oxidoreductase [Rhodocyclaceae bacterium]MBX3666882.1 hydroxysqualene dehydroxylase HpnE [Rhodocyclaceae bacterium]